MSNAHENDLRNQVAALTADNARLTHDLSELSMTLAAAEVAIDSFRAEVARLRAACEAAIRYVDHWNDIDTPDPPDEMGTTNGDQLLIDLNLLARAALAPSGSAPTGTPNE